MSLQKIKLLLDEASDLLSRDFQDIQLLALEAQRIQDFINEIEINELLAADIERDSNSDLNHLKQTDKKMIEKARRVFQNNTSGGLDV